MMSFLDLLVVVGMTFLRIGVPLLVMAGLVYGLKRLDRRWEAEATASRQAESAVQPAAQPQAPKPGTVVRVPAPQPQLPWVPPPAVEKLPAQPGMMAAAAPQPGRQARDHSDAKGAQCAAPQQSGVPCWQARFDAEGAIPEECVKCDQFQRYPKM